MLLLDLQFSGVFDGNDSLGFRDEARKNVKQCRLAGASTAGHYNIQSRLDRTL